MRRLGGKCFRAPRLDLVEGTCLALLLAVAVVVAITTGYGKWQRNKQRRTASDIRDVAMAVESYAVDHRRYPPSARSRTVAALASWIEPTYLEVVPRRDAWGGELLYEATPDGDSYVIRSLAKDGVVSGPTVGMTTDFRHDIVFADGSFLVSPDGRRH
ncbi:MAG: type II secretion system protein GspG [Acidobacteriota bacterium]